MNEEIKEILNNIEINELKYNKWCCSVEKDNMQKILDYITNLLQEIKEANDSITWWTNRFKAVERDNRELKEENERLKEDLKGQEALTLLFSNVSHDYYTRIEKAIEYIQNQNNITKHGIYPNYTYEVDTKDLLNILQGSDNE